MPETCFRNALCSPSSRLSCWRSPLVSSALPPPYPTASEHQILFQSDREDNVELFAINTDSSGLINLTNHPAEDLSPDW